MVDKNLYDEKFYESTFDHVYSASKILKILFKYHMPESVIDIGCGSGSWLKAASNLGIKNLTGVEGDWLNPDLIISEDIELIMHDISKSLPTLSRYDLAITLEVAEHLDESRARRFVKELCNLSDVILFSAAIPFQGGDNHVNEQWQSYWAMLFKENNFKALDLIRPLVWDDDKVKSWYKQNCLVYVNQNFTFNVSPSIKKQPLDIVHPDIFKNNPGKYPYTINTNFNKIDKNKSKKLIRILLFIIVLGLTSFFFNLLFF